MVDWLYTESVALAEPLKGNAVASGLAAYLRAEIARRGWDDSELARRAGIDKGGLSYILNHPDAEPKLRTLRQLARGLGVPLGQLVKVLGFDLGPEGTDADIERMAILVDSVPDLQDMVYKMARLLPEERVAALAYVEGMIRRRLPE